MPDPRGPQTSKGAIAVDVDDTLNDFTETLNTGLFTGDPGYNLPAEKFEKYLGMVRRGEDEPSGLLSTEYSYFRQRIHMECFDRTLPLPGAVEFMQWLRTEGWRVVILTHRDLRRSGAVTRKWLTEHEIPFDHLFMTVNKIGFCNAWGIRRLVDDHWVNLQQWQPNCGVEILYPHTMRLPKHLPEIGQSGRAFADFDQLKEWLCA